MTAKKLYVYDYVDGVTSNYHDGGAVLIVTDRDPQAELETMPNEWTDSRPAPKLGDPDLVLDVSPESENAVRIFPDSGCC